MPSPATKHHATQSPAPPKPIRLNIERSMTPTKPSLPPITVSGNKNPVVEPEAGIGDDWNAKTKAGESWGEHHNLVDVATNSLDRLSEQQRLVQNRNQDLVVHSSTPQALSQQANDFSSQ